MRFHDVYVLYVLSLLKVGAARCSFTVLQIKYLQHPVMCGKSPHIPWPLQNKQEGFSVEGQPPACQQVRFFGRGGGPRNEKVLTESITRKRRPLDQTNLLTDTTENITLPQTTHAGGKKTTKTGIKTILTSR